MSMYTKEHIPLKLSTLCRTRLIFETAL